MPSPRAGSRTARRRHRPGPCPAQAVRGTIFPSSRLSVWSMEAATASRSGGGSVRPHEPQTPLAAVRVRRRSGRSSALVCSPSAPSTRFPCRCDRTAALADCSSEGAVRTSLGMRRGYRRAAGRGAASARRPGRALADSAVPLGLLPGDQALGVDPLASSGRRSAMPAMMPAPHRMNQSRFEKNGTICHRNSSSSSPAAAKPRLHFGDARDHPLLRPLLGRQPRRQDPDHDRQHQHDAEHGREPDDDRALNRGTGVGPPVRG